MVSPDYALKKTGEGKIFAYQGIAGANAFFSDTFTKFGVLTFDLTQVPGYLDYANLYDHYRIKAVEVLFRPTGIQSVESAYAVAGVVNVPRLFTVIDLDDNSTPASLDDVRRYSNVVETAATSAQSRLFTPRWLSPVYISALSSGYVMGDPRSWLDLANPNIPHYAVKYAITADGGASLNQRFVYTVEIKYWIEFARVR